MFLKPMPLDSVILKTLKTALSRREPLRKITNAIRLVNGRGDGLEGLILEQYDKHFLAQVLDRRWVAQAEALKSFLVESFPVEYFILKDRTQSTASQADGFKSHVLLGSSSQAVISENGLNFAVDLNDGLNTGLFLDMRANRKLVGQHCKAKRVLNCFAYTCSFGVYAKAAGASSTVNVDISKKVLNRGLQNYQLNSFQEDKGDFMKADAVQYLQVAVKKDNRFDVIVIDPPSFARVEGKVFNVAKALPVLISHALHILNEGGRLFISTNFSGLSYLQLEQMLKDLKTIRAYKKISRCGQDQDFVGSGSSKESYLAALWVEY